jgi:hypothetical protein
MDDLVSDRPELAATIDGRRRGPPPLPMALQGLTNPNEDLDP